MKQHNKFNLGRRSKRVYNSGLNPDVKKLIDAMLQVSPIDFTLTDGKRTAKQQFVLFQIGRRWNFELNLWIKTGDAVTNCDGYEFKSRHQSGNALDFAAYIPGKPVLSYDKIHMAVLIGSFLTVSEILYAQGETTSIFRSGADWDSDTQYLEPGTFHDMPHIERIEP
jgi:hypothetical protein